MQSPYVMQAPVHINGSTTVLSAPYVMQGRDAAIPDERQAFHIIGGGPVGLATALFLAKEGLSSVVYEGRPDIPNNVEESYPIGINPRALKALDAIDPLLAKEAREHGRVVDSWQIFGGPIRVAKLDSGVVYGTSRGRINSLLFEWAAKNPLIKILFNHKLVDMDFDRRQLVLQKRETGERVTVQASRVIGADGLYSAVRRSMEQKCQGFRAEMSTWTNEFRVLFAKPGDLPPQLDTKVHYIFSGCYTATVDNGGEQQWTLVMGARDDSSAAEKKLILGKEATPDNVQALRKMIEQRAPLAAALIDDKELTRYFGRRTYRGAIVKVPRINEGEWLCLLGDAAHSVLPAVGEGINSGLEDAMHLWEAIKTQGGSEASALFAALNAQRLPDMHAISDYAFYLNEIPRFSGEKAARVMMMVSNGWFTSKTINNLLFGPEGEKRTRYRDIVGAFNLQKLLILNFWRLLMYPLMLVIEILFLPLTLWKIACRPADNKVDDYSIKPPVGDVDNV